MTRTVTAAGALLLALMVGFGAAWVVLDRDPDDRELACAGARSLPQDLGDRWSLAELDKIDGVAMLAKAAGSTGDDHDDLDTLGRAGRDLQEVVRGARTERYASARESLLDAC